MHFRQHRGCPPCAGILLAAGLALAALVIQMASNSATLLQWQRGGGRMFSWFTSHLCHWSWNHLAWDLAVFSVLSWICLRLAPSRFVWCVLLSAAFIPLEVRLNQPLLDSYRGLSGIDCALLGLAVAALWRHSREGLEGLANKVLAVAGSVMFLAKTAYEMSTGATLFVESGPQSFIPVPSAHFVGFLSGIAVGLPSFSRRAAHIR